MNCDVRAASLTDAQRALLVFAQKITEDSSAISVHDVEGLRGNGWSDLQIAEAIHIAALFACFNRVVNAFGLPSQGLLGAAEDALPTPAVSSLRLSCIAAVVR